MGLGITLWAEKIPSTTDVASLNTFGRNEIEVALISSALLRIACLVILYKSCRLPDQELAADGVSGPVCGLALDYLSKMKIAVVVRQLDLGHILWCGRVVRVERAASLRCVLPRCGARPASSESATRSRSTSAPTC